MSKTLSNFKSNSLDGRKIVGFDIRKQGSLKKLFMTSYDESVRYEDINERFQKYQSGINLFYVDPRSIKKLDLPPDARIIAFDLPSDFVKDMIAGQVSSPEPLPSIDLSAGWEFAGFDVVDPRTQSSAFHAFDLDGVYIASTLKRFSIQPNKYGLIESEKEGMPIVDFFSKEFPEHSPFVLAGIWLIDEAGK